MINMITAKEAAARTKANAAAETDKLIAQANDFLKIVNQDIENALNGLESSVHYKLDTFKKNEKFSHFPPFSRQVEYEYMQVSTYVTDFGTFVVNALELADYKVELNSYNLTISWTHLIQSVGK